MPMIIPANRPKILRGEAEHLINYHKAMFPQLFTEKDVVNVLWIRGYFLNSLGKKGLNDYNVYDDAAIIVATGYYKTFNANCDPSFVTHPKTGKKLAKLNLGVYPFYQGKHKGQYDAFRAYPEGVVLPCTRDGKLATCRYVNCHYGGENPQSWYVTWSEACVTLPKSQFVERDAKKGFQPELYGLMRTHKQRTVNFILIEKVFVNNVERYRSAKNEFIPASIEVEEIQAGSAIESGIAAFPVTHELPSVADFQSPIEEPVVLEIAKGFPYEVKVTSNLGETVTDVVSAETTYKDKIQDCFSTATELQGKAGEIVGTLDQVRQSGMAAYETAIKVTSGKTTAFNVQVLGLVVSAFVTAVGFVRENWKLIALGAVCFVAICIVLYIVFTFINGLKMKYAADPSKHNVE